jgi:hypothetical protein
MQPLLIWLLASLLAVALMGSWPYLALAILLVGGIAMGISCLWAGETGSDHRSQEGSRPAGGK